MKLVIGSKNYSSWSLRPWLVLRQAAIPFEEECLRFTDPAFKRRVLELSGAGKVPVLEDEGLVVWDSLAIVEYLAERFPGARIWPEARASRARARALCAEVHAGYGGLRALMPFNATARFSGILLRTEVRRELERVFALWQDARPFLFGEFCAADAFFAPLTRRLVTYGVELPPAAARYVEAIERLDAMRDWLAAAAAEGEFYPSGEPYRSAPG